MPSAIIQPNFEFCLQWLNEKGISCENNLEKICNQEKLINQIQKEIDIYNLNTGLWSKGSTGGLARKNHASINYNGKLYTWGGEDQNGSLVSSLDIYDSAMDNWFQRTSEGTTRKHHCACEFEGRIYFWGGVNETNQMINVFDIYDINSNVWFTGPMSGETRKNSSCVSFEGKIYYLRRYVHNIPECLTVKNVRFTWYRLSNITVYSFHTLISILFYFKSKILV